MRADCTNDACKIASIFAFEKNKCKKMKARSVITIGLGLLLFVACKQQEQQQVEGENYPLLTLKPENRQLSVKYSEVIEGSGSSSAGLRNDHTGVCRRRGTCPKGTSIVRDRSGSL